ncbi:MAG: ATP-binding protein, partial [Cyclobacteriaceae bacterium]|nr:ATP-binding protein [Cyclobacteriaceae bacterium]
LEEVFTDALHIIRELSFPGKVLPLFHHYLKAGYFPFARSEEESDFFVKLNQVINTTLETDLALMENYSAGNITKIKRLLGVLAESVPFTPNISALASKMQLGRDTVNTYLHHLEKAGLLNLLYRSSRGVAALQKPDKIFLENTNFSFALQNQPDTGSLRETFFLNQLRHAGHAVNLPDKGDFFIDRKWTIEVGGVGKKDKQPVNTKADFLVLDNLETAYQNRIPLWLFGFLY